MTLGPSLGWRQSEQPLCAAQARPQPRLQLRPAVYSLWEVRVIQRGLQDTCWEHYREGVVSVRPTPCRPHYLPGHTPLPIWFLLGR